MLIKFDSALFLCHGILLCQSCLTRNCITQIHSPYLLLPYDHENATSCSLFDPLHDKKFYQLDKLPKPAQGGKLFKGSFHGWLVTADDNSPSVGLINPLTGAQLKLPQRSSFPDVVKYRSNKPDHEYDIRAAYDKTGYYTLSSTHVRNFFTYKIVVLGSPSTSDDYLAVAIYGEFDRLAYCRKGYKKWVHLAGDRKPYVDVTFFRGQLYALACNKELLICEVGKCGGPIVTEIKNPACSPRSIGCTLYLVEWASDG
ncbi:hypothetical protein RHMOL_Rhmol10G0288800 [Rhododendron molle]|uniref:Uncharacterized protein n=1 Tax=Rhododendron molle TaxID=49168 RepID=A0ACC0M8X1_RHOML|nr:hypothetical protein RHMOL_Rhmol10G0288800 [Rhododendron molle]